MGQQQTLLLPEQQGRQQQALRLRRQQQQQQDRRQRVLGEQQRRQQQVNQPELRSCTRRTQQALTQVQLHQHRQHDRHPLSSTLLQWLRLIPALCGCSCVLLTSVAAATFAASEQAAAVLATAATATAPSRLLQQHTSFSVQCHSQPVPLPQVTPPSRRRQVQQQRRQHQQQHQLLLQRDQQQQHRIQQQQQHRLLQHGQPQLHPLQHGHPQEQQERGTKQHQFAVVARHQHTAAQQRWLQQRHQQQQAQEQQQQQGQRWELGRPEEQRELHGRQLQQPQEAVARQEQQEVVAQQQQRRELQRQQQQQERHLSQPQVGGPAIGVAEQKLRCGLQGRSSFLASVCSRLPQRCNSNSRQLHFSISALLSFHPESRRFCPFPFLRQRSGVCPGSGSQATSAAAATAGFFAAASAASCATVRTHAAANFPCAASAFSSLPAAAGASFANRTCSLPPDCCARPAAFASSPPPLALPLASAAAADQPLAAGRGKSELCLPTASGAATAAAGGREATTAAASAAPTSASTRLARSSSFPSSAFSSPFFPVCSFPLPSSSPFSSAVASSSRFISSPFPSSACLRSGFSALLASSKTRQQQQQQQLSADVPPPDLQQQQGLSLPVGGTIRAAEEEEKDAPSEKDLQLTAADLRLYEELGVSPHAPGWEVVQGYEVHAQEEAAAAAGEEEGSSSGGRPSLEDRWLQVYGKQVNRDFLALCGRFLQQQQQPRSWVKRWLAAAVPKRMRSWLQSAAAAAPPLLHVAADATAAATPEDDTWGSELPSERDPTYISQVEEAPRGVKEIMMGLGDRSGLFKDVLAMEGSYAAAAGAGSSRFRSLFRRLGWKRVAATAGYFLPLALLSGVSARLITPSITTALGLAASYMCSSSSRGGVSSTRNLVNRRTVGLTAVLLALHACAGAALASYIYPAVNALPWAIGADALVASNVILQWWLATLLYYTGPAEEAAAAAEEEEQQQAAAAGEKDGGIRDRQGGGGGGGEGEDGEGGGSEDTDSLDELRDAIEEE